MPFFGCNDIFTHCDLKVSSSQAKIDEWFKVLKCTLKGLQKSKRELVKSKPKALQHFKVDPVKKIDETFYKQAESMCTKWTLI